MRRRTALVTGLLLAGVTALPAQRHASWNLSVDNDAFAFWESAQARSDRDYSSGIRLGTARPLVRRGRWDRTLVLALDHQLFTPDIRSPDPPPGDRPYAALLSVHGALQYDRPEARHELRITTSVTGPPALGEEFQRLVHSLLGSPPPQGWQRQLPFDIGISVAYRGDRHLAEAGDEDGLGVRTAAQWGAELGTIRSLASAGLGATLGWRPPRVWQPLAPPEAEQDGIRVFLPLAARLDVVGRSIVVDGSVIGDAAASAIDRKTLVPHAQFGIGVELGDVAVEWVGHIVGRDFEAQPGLHRYGTFRVTVR